MQAASAVTAPIPKLVKACAIFARTVPGTLMRWMFGWNLVAVPETYSLKFLETMKFKIRQSRVMMKGIIILCVRFGFNPFEGQGGVAECVLLKVSLAMCRKTNFICSLRFN